MLYGLNLELSNIYASIKKKKPIVSVMAMIKTIVNHL